MEVLLLRVKYPVSTKHFDLNKGIKTYPMRMRYVTPEQINFKSENLYKIDSIIENAIYAQATPGCQVLIVKDGNVFNKAYGFHTYQKKNPVLTTDVYDVASITKIIATVPMLMKMVDSGYLDLENTLGDYIDLDSTNKDSLVKRYFSTSILIKTLDSILQKTLDSDSTGLLTFRDTLYSDVYDKTYTHHVANNLFLHSQYPDSIIHQIVQSDLLIKKKYKYSDLGYYYGKDKNKNSSFKVLDDYLKIDSIEVLEWDLSLIL